MLCSKKVKTCKILKSLILIFLSTKNNTGQHQNPPINFFFSDRFYDTKSKYGNQIALSCTFFFFCREVVFEINIAKTKLQKLTLAKTLMLKAFYSFIFGFSCSLFCSTLLWKRFPTFSDCWGSEFMHIQYQMTFLIRNRWYFTY